MHMCKVSWIDSRDSQMTRNYSIIIGGHKFCKTDKNRRRAKQNELLLGDMVLIKILKFEYSKDIIDQVYYGSWCIGWKSSIMFAQYMWSRYIDVPSKVWAAQSKVNKKINFQIVSMHPFTYNLYYILAWKIKDLFRFKPVLIITGYPKPRTRPSVWFFPGHKPWTVPWSGSGGFRFEPRFWTECCHP
jgi:hypothetical protein